MIHGPSSGREAKEVTVDYFFIGTKDQFETTEYIPNEFDFD